MSAHVSLLSPPHRYRNEHCSALLSVGIIETLIDLNLLQMHHFANITVSTH